MRLIPVLSKEYEVSLIVKGYCPTSMKVGIMRKNGGQHPSNRMTKSGVEVI